MNLGLGGFCGGIRQSVARVWNAGNGLVFGAVVGLGAGRATFVANICMI